MCEKNALIVLEYGDLKGDFHRLHGRHEALTK